MLPAGLGAVIEEGSWGIHPVFKLLQKTGGLERQEMYNIFNMGIGMVVAVSPDDAAAVVEHFTNCGEQASVIGKVTGQAGIKVMPYGGAI
jgi:phosphoribosylformylglycinamidine cyclo-ligase